MVVLQRTSSGIACLKLEWGISEIHGTRIARSLPTVVPDTRFQAGMTVFVIHLNKVELIGYRFIGLCRLDQPE